MIPLIAASTLIGGVALLKKCFEWRRDERDRFKALREGTTWELVPTGLIEREVRAELGRGGRVLPYSATFGAQGVVAWTGGLGVHRIEGLEVLDVDVPNRRAFHCWSYRSPRGDILRSPPPCERRRSSATPPLPWPTAWTRTWTRRASTAGPCS